jgi:hypothetical protein
MNLVSTKVVLELQNALSVFKFYASQFRSDASQSSIGYRDLEMQYCILCEQGTLKIQKFHLKTSR